jgi:hypothetical protein
MASRPAAALGDAKSTKRTKFLVLDSRVVAGTQNTKLTLGKVEKHTANPLFGEDKPWEKRYDNVYARVIYDEQDRLYKCWYMKVMGTKGVSDRWAERPVRIL